MRKAVQRMLLVVLLVLSGGTLVTGTASAGSHPGRSKFPDVISLPDGFQPEGIAVGRGTTFFVGSRASGAIYRGDLRTGKGSILVEGSTSGSATTGLEVDRRNRLWASGAGTGTGKVFDTKSGKLLASYQFVDIASTPTFINDVVITRDAAYFTDSLNQVLYRVAIGRGGALPKTFTTLPLTGDLVYGEGFNLNGIEASRNGRSLVVVQSNTGFLFKVDAATGLTTRIDLGSTLLTNGDGMLRRGGKLYVVQNQDNKIAELSLNRSWTAGQLVREITDPDFQVPATIAAFGRSLYAVNARFDVPPPNEATTYTVVKVRLR